MMEVCCKNIVLHPKFLEILFAFKSKVSSVFREVLGIHEIHHMALSRVNKNNELISLSSTPAMEFNLFSSTLWRYDKTYHPNWFKQCTQAHWQQLYYQPRYDELYYLKQIKHKYPVGLSLATTQDHMPLICSLASHNTGDHAHELFTTHHDDFYKMSLYCANLLTPIFNDCDAIIAKAFTFSGVK